MDSLTQITLGAAVGEVVLGRKVGNRALLWGAVGGTIPDLDVLANFFMSEVDALAFHRGVSHSIFFSVVGGILFGWLTEKFYKSKYQRYLAFAGWAAFVFGVLLLLNIILRKQAVHLLAFALSLLLYLFLIARLARSYLFTDRALPSASMRDWQMLFFWSILTHAFLDAFTTYGTQLFQPFSDFRVALNTISVADPLYTIPFLICVILTSFLSRSSVKRRIINYTGLGISTVYLLFTVINKSAINRVFSESLGTQGIAYDRFMTNPTILNNVLWYGAADTDSVYYVGLYSLFDKDKKIDFIKVRKNEELLDAKSDDHTVQTLKWFSDGYYNVIIRKDGLPQMNDLRYGSMNLESMDENDYIFRFPLQLDENGYYSIKDAEGGPPEGDEREMMKSLFERIKGI